MKQADYSPSDFKPSERHRLFGGQLVKPRDNLMDGVL